MFLLVIQCYIRCVSTLDCPRDVIFRREGGEMKPHHSSLSLREPRSDCQSPLIRGPDLVIVEKGHIFYQDS